MYNLTIATLGGHSALEICQGAKKLNFRTLVITQKGREKTYTKYFQNLVDEYVIVDKFEVLTGKKVVHILRKKPCIFIPHRYINVYCSLNKFENQFPIKVFGNRFLLKYEEREGKYNQYQLMEEANISYPKRVSDPKNINSLVIVKVKEAQRGYERAFFFASNYHEYKKNASRLQTEGKIKHSDLENAIIEEYLIGVQVNFNFFYSPLTGSIELLGTDTRRQTNIDGLIRIPAKEQLLVGDKIAPSYIESGHVAVTIKESLLEKAFEIAEKLVKTCRKIHSVGIIGPFALQSVIVAGPPEEKIVVFDLSFRIPGSPGIAFTPYSQYLYGRTVSFGERIAMEIEKALKNNQIKKITT